MGKLIGIGTAAVLGKNEQVERLGGSVQVEEERQKTAPIQSLKRNFLHLLQPNKGQSRREDEQERRQRAFSAPESVVATEYLEICSE